MISLKSAAKQGDASNDQAGHLLVASYRGTPRSDKSFPNMLIARRPRRSPYTAGLRDFFVPEYFAHREEYSRPGGVFRPNARQPKVGEPGKQWPHNNVGSVLLGRIIENVSDLRNEILDLLTETPMRIPLHPYSLP